MIYSIASTAVPEWLTAANYKDGCCIWREEFQTNETVVHIKCNRFYHYICIREYWYVLGALKFKMVLMHSFRDTWGQHEFTCCLCRKSCIRFVLAETAGMKPEVWDVW